MNQIKFTITGVEHKEVALPSVAFDNEAIYKPIREMFNIPAEDDMHIYGVGENKIEDVKSLTSSFSASGLIYRICILNKNVISSKLNQPKSTTVPEELLVDPVSRKRYVCINPKCRKTFNECEKLFKHYQVHYKEKPYKCTYYNCSKSFTSKSQLKTHQVIHQPSKVYTCTYPGCDKSYAKKCRLTVHLRSHTGDKPFICTYEGCGKRFSEKGNLKTHIRTHTGEKPYFCTFTGCKKRFSTQGHLIDHIRSHGDEKPYPCTLCPKAFMRASTLKVHMRDHTGERPFRCNKCTKNFKEARSLRAHMKVHDKENSKEIETSVTKQKPIPKYNEIKESCSRVSTMASGDFGGAFEIDLLVKDKDRNSNSNSTTSVEGISKSPQADEVLFSSFPKSFVSNFNPREFYNKPVCFPLGDYKERIKEICKSVSPNCATMRASNWPLPGYNNMLPLPVISAEKLEASRTKALNHLSNQLFDDFL